MTLSLKSKKNIIPAPGVAPTGCEKAGSASYQIILCLLAFRNCVCSQIENSSRFGNQTQREISIETSIHWIILTFLFIVEAVPTNIAIKQTWNKIYKLQVIELNFYLPSTMIFYIHTRIK